MIAYTLVSLLLLQS